MTRYARSKGSKSSNERLPNDPTPWHIMKQQLESATHKKQEPQIKTKSAKQLLADKEELYYAQSLGNIKTDWAKFENNASTIDTLRNGKVQKKSKDQNKILNTVQKLTAEETALDNSKTKNKTSRKYLEDKCNSKETKLKRKNNNITITSNLNESTKKKQKTNVEHVLEHTSKAIENTLKKKQKNNHKSTDSDSDQHIDKNYEIKVKNPFKYTVDETKDDQLEKPLGNNSKNESEDYTENNNILTKRQKRNKNKIKNKNDSISNMSVNVQKNNCSDSIYSNQSRKFHNRFDNNIPRKFQKKVAKVRDNKEHLRRKPDTGLIKVTINGMDVEIVKYDGYPVIKKDAERLIELRKEMILKGIPIFEVNAAMKLERRKCEKALARIRKQVCFHCRKAGHNLSECPELNKEEMSTGICFKCGSTEHTHFECKVYKNDEYRFAKCFICREQGHIAKQCPDNPKGLYPDGGACKICGDVTHLKKDCLNVIKQKEEATITLDTINNKNLESLDEEINKVNVEVKPNKKIVKF